VAAVPTMIDRFCFRRANPGWRLPEPVATAPRVTDREATAFALLVPLLGCGEEAAVIAFDALAEAEADPDAAAALALIAREEEVHDAMLKSVAAALPAVDDQRLRREARRFHVRLSRSGAVAHLARIAAIDASLCTILSRLNRAGTPIAGDPVLAGVLRQIHHDETRHVRVARALARRDAAKNALDALAEEARTTLANVLRLAADAFEVLAVDAALLDRDLCQVPAGLFAP